MRIAVDAMGGDYAPHAAVEGAFLAAELFNIPVILVGRENEVKKELAKHSYEGLPISIIHSSEVIEMEESPSIAIRKKKDSSMAVCFSLVKEGKAAAVVSAGNSGAVMAFAMITLKNLEGVDRPAIAVPIPTLKGSCLLIDAGANVDCKPYHLLQFAVMGAVFAKTIQGKDEVVIGLLSNGEEESKGNELTRDTHSLLKQLALNYAGYVEGRDIFTGKVDVILCDGFVGNVMLKSLEGLAETVIGTLKEEISRDLFSKIGLFLSKRALKRLKQRFDYTEYGGAPLLGVNGVCIICHGISNSKAICNAIKIAYELSRLDLNTCLRDELKKYSALIFRGTGSS